MIGVIGAGPAGSFAAYQLAKKGYDVKLFEEHHYIGKPVQCTGIVTDGIKEIFTPKKETIVNTIERVKVHTAKESCEIKLRRPDIILDRTAFDQSIAHMAQDAGAEVLMGCRFTNLEKKEKEIKIDIQHTKKNEKKSYGVTQLIGADGPNAQVAKSAGIFGDRVFYYGAQATIKGNFDPQCYEVYLGNVCPNFFAWVVPENEHMARAGLATLEKPHQYFQSFLKKLNSPTVCECQGGLIPLYDPKLKTEKENIFLVGDAALQVKATTGGGIIQGIMAAKALADAIEKNKSYESEWKKVLGKDLWLHLFIRRMMNKFSDQDYDYMLSLVKQQRVKNILESFDRDYPTRFLLKLGITEPRFASFARFLF